MRKMMFCMLAAVIVLVSGGFVSMSGAGPQERKVIKTTTDSRGFTKRHTQVDLMLETAKQYYAAKQYEKAAVEFEKVFAADASRLDALHDLGQCYKHLKEFDKAAVVYKKATISHSDDLRVLSNLGYYQIRAKDLDGAMTTYRTVLSKDPVNYDALQRLGYLSEKAGKYDESLAYYERALKQKPNDVQTMGSIAKIHMSKGEFDVALPMYERAIAGAPEDLAPKLKDQLGKIYIGQKQFKKSAVIYEELVAIDAGRYAWQFNCGISLMQLKRAKEAVPHLEKAIELKPDYCSGYHTLAGAYNDANLHSKAAQVVQQGIQHCENKKKGALYYEWGKALEGLKRYDEAITKFEVAVNDPTYGPFAKKQIKRQLDLIQRDKAMRGQ